MNKIIINIIASIYILSIGLFMTSCDGSHAGNMEFSGEVKVLSFEMNGVETTIDHAGHSIVGYLPWSHDLKSIDTQIRVSEGATIEPGSESGKDLSSSASYLVTNGNLYNTYDVTASYSKFLNFNLGKYSGEINHSTGEIIVKYPKEEAVTSVFTTFETSPGATSSKESGARYDYTEPVVFTLTYLGETFDYKVTVVPTNFASVAFLGTAASAKDIENEDEKAAYKWFSENIPNATYVSFTDIRDDKVNLSEYSVLWWHLDGGSRDLSSIATSPSVLSSVKSYFENGGSLFLSSWAVQYAANIGATKDNKPANNLWGEANAKDAVTLNDPWGICFTGYESHPIFAGLDKPAGVNNKVNLLSTGLKVKAHNAVWNFTEDWVDYKSKSAWEAANGGVGLASYHWNDGNNERAVMFEYPKINNKGGVVCIGSEAYDWAVEGVNAYQHNLEKLTANIISYLSN